MDNVPVVAVEADLIEVPLEVAVPALPSAAIGVATRALARNRFHALTALDGDDNLDISALPDLSLPTAVFGATATANPGRPTRFLPAARSKWSDVADVDFGVPTAPALQLNPQSKDSWIKVGSRKFGMPRGAAPNKEDIVEPEVDADEEFSWGYVLGGKVPDMKKWSQQTRSGRIGRQDVPATITHGSYGPAGHEK